MEDSKSVIENGLPIKSEIPTHIGKTRLGLAYEALHSVASGQDKDRWISWEESKGILSLIQPHEHVLKQALSRPSHFEKVISDMGKLMNIHGGDVSAFAEKFIQESFPDIEKFVTDKGLTSVMEVCSKLSGRSSDPQLKKMVINFMVNHFAPWLPQIQARWPGLHPGIQGRVVQIVSDIIESSNDNQSRQIAQNILETFRREDLYRRDFSHDLARLYVEEPKDINALLELFGLDPKIILPAWDISSDSWLKKYTYRDNASAIFSLEGVSPGASKSLHNENGIMDFGRYPESLLKTQFERKEEIGAPYGAIFFSRSDWNGALYQYKEIIEKLHRQLNEIGCNLKVFEVENKLDFLGKLNFSRHKYGPLSFAIIGGHGASDFIQLGNLKDKSKSNPKEIVSGEDFLRKGAASFYAAFTENPTIILVACSTGSNGGIGEKISRLGAEVIAPDRSVSISNISVAEQNNRLKFSVEYRK